MLSELLLVHGVSENGRSVPCALLGDSEAGAGGALEWRDAMCAVSEQVWRTLK